MADRTERKRALAGGGILCARPRGCRGKRKNNHHPFRHDLVSVTLHASLSTSALLLQNAFHRQGRTLTSELNLPPRKPYLVAATVILAAIDAKLVLLNSPFAAALLAH